MRVRCIHVLRKPLAESSVAANVLKYGCGGLNIDSARIRANVAEMQGRSGKAAETNRVYSPGIHNPGEALWEPDTKGRWPANLILEHRSGCQQVGTRQVKSSAPASGPTLTGESTSNSRGKFRGVEATPSYADADGTETIPAWDCQPGCPVKELDEQSGHLHATDNVRITPKGNSNGVTGWGRGRGALPRENYQDTGGASRFFKQVHK